MQHLYSGGLRGGLFAVAFVLSLGTPAFSADYYVSPNGNDGSTGTKSHPWQSLAKVNATSLSAGDRVLLASGATFIGSLTLSSKETGTPGKPIVICSTGRAAATIFAPGQTAIAAVGGGIVIRSLRLRGAEEKSAKSHGISFYTEAGDRAKCRDINIDDVEVTGFGDDGISIGSGGNAGAGYTNVRITRANVHDNFGSGIITFNKVSAEKPSYAHRDFYIADCTLARNHSGSGMVISGVNHALIKFCRAVKNDGHGGGVGIWAYAARNVTFQYCIASGTTSDNGGDGGGFDLDGACVDCKIQSCLTYGNDGPGYMHCDYPSATPTRNNVIRASVSVNDGRKAKGGAYGFGFCTWGSGLDACTISNNLTYVTDSDPKDRQNGVYWVSYIPESAANSQFDKGRQHLTGAVFRDNFALVTGSGIAFVSTDMPGATTANVLFQGNIFLSIRGLSPPFLQGATRFASASEWRKSTGQELSDEQGSPKSFMDLQPTQAKELLQITEPRRLPMQGQVQILKRMLSRSP